MLLVERSIYSKSNRGRGSCMILNMKGSDFIRDNRSPKAKSEAVSRVMSANKAKNTKPELILRKLLSSASVRGYRLHPRSISGRPDIAFTKKKIAIFMNGCYWHHCLKCDLPLPTHNRVFWEKKFIRNRERDKEKIDLLRKEGWISVVVWEHEMQKKPSLVIKKVTSLLSRRTPRSF